MALPVKASGIVVQVSGMYPFVLVEFSGMMMVEWIGGLACTSIFTFFDTAMIRSVFFFNISRVNRNMLNKHHNQY